jgi:hypothetical protein
MSNIDSNMDYIIYINDEVSQLEIELENDVLELSPSFIDSHYENRYINTSSYIIINL